MRKEDIILEVEFFINSIVPSSYLRMHKIMNVLEINGSTIKAEVKHFQNPYLTEYRPDAKIVVDFINCGVDVVELVNKKIARRREKNLNKLI